VQPNATEGQEPSGVRAEACVPAGHFEESRARPDAPGRPCPRIAYDLKR
jgi:hypothetical protein